MKYKVSIIIILLIISIFASGCFEKDDKKTIEPFQFTVTDAPGNSNFSGTPDTFEPGEPLISLVQNSEQKIEWEKIEIKCEVKEVNRFYYLEVLSINENKNVVVSSEGDIIVLTLQNNEDSLKRGDYIALKCSIDEKTLFASSNFIKIE